LAEPLCAHAQHEGENGSGMRFTMSKLITSNTFRTLSFALTCQELHAQPLVRKERCAGYVLRTVHSQMPSAETARSVTGPTCGMRARIRA